MKLGNAVAHIDEIQYWVYSKYPTVLEKQENGKWVETDDPAFEPSKTYIVNDAFAPFRIAEMEGKQLAHFNSTTGKWEKASLVREGCRPLDNLYYTFPAHWKILDH